LLLVRDGVPGLPNIAAECLLAALRFAALWTVFSVLHRPRTKLRRVLAIGIMALQYPFCRVLFFASGGNFAASVAGDTVLFLTLALICEAEPAPGVSDAASLAGGDLLRPLVSALYFDGMLQFINYIMSCYMYAFAGTLPPSFSLWSYFWKTIEGLVLLFWTLFYCRVARNMTANPPLSFSLLTVLAPLAGLAVIAASTNQTRLLLDYGVNIFLSGGLFGTLIVIFNMGVFYLYTKLSVAHEALLCAQDLALPRRTPEQGLSAAFIEKYAITPREREVVEALVQGKTDKEIAVNLDIAVNTVQVHLKRIYRKTGAAGRFALSALVRQDPRLASREVNPLR
jgi:DNA-binding CsgD family transcriptional regulator